MRITLTPELCRKVARMKQQGFSDAEVIGHFPNITPSILHDVCRGHLASSATQIRKDRSTFPKIEPWERVEVAAEDEDEELRLYPF